MKKFLTVLLALSVVFTYTVGTAFAAQTTDEKTTAVEKDLKLATEVLDSFAANFQATEKTAGTYDDAAIEFAVKAVKDLGLLFINNYSAEKAAEAGDYTGNPVTTELNKWLDSTNGNPTAAGIGAYAFTKASFQAAYDSLVGDKDLDAVKAAALAKIAAVDPAAYYVDEETNTDDAAAAKALKEKAEKAVKAVVKENNQIKKVFVDDSNLGAANKGYKDAVNAILYGCAADGTGILDASNTMTEQNAAAVKGLFAELDALTTIAEHDKEVANNKEQVSFALSELSTYGKVTFYKAKRVTASDTGKTDVSGAYEWVDGVGNAGTLNGVAVADKTAATDAEVAAANAALLTRIQKALSVMEVYLAENPSDVSKVISGQDDVNHYLSPTGFANIITKAEAAIAKYEALEKEAASKKTELNPVTGTKKYDDAEIEKALAKAQTRLYKGCMTGVDVTDAWDNLSDISSVLDKAIADAKAKFNSGKKADEKYTAAYYDTDLDVQTAVGNMLKKAQEDLTAAKSVEEVEKIMSELDTALAKVRTAENETAVEAAITAAKYQDFLDSYATAQQALKGSDYRADSFTAAKAAGMELLNSAMTKDELPALLEKAKALFDTIKTDAEIKAAGKAVADMISALPSKVTLAERNALLAAKKAKADFDEMYGSKDADVYNQALLTSKLAALKALEIKSLTDAINALPATLTAKDADKVKAIRAELEDYLAEYEIPSYGYKGDEAAFTLTVAIYDKLTDAEKEIADIEMAAVQALIYALPVETTLKDADAVKAARAAFDALPKTNQQTLIANGYYAKLTKAEAQLETLQAVQNEKIKAGVQATKIRIYSKAYKGYTRISWKKSLGFKVDGYEVYRATKKNGKYTKIWTAKSTGKSVKNTKNLISGKKYYYYVKGFRMIDGEKVYTKKSITIYRTAK